MAHPGNVVLGRCFFEERIGARAVRTFHVLPFHDGNLGAGGRLERRGVMDLRPRRGNIELGACGRRERQGHRREKPRRSGQQAGTAESRKTDAFKTKHGYWTTPCH